MLDENGKPVTEAGPARPVLVLGLTAVPGAGDTFLAVERGPHRPADRRAAAGPRAGGAASPTARGRATLETLLERIKEGERTTLTLILKGDVLRFGGGPGGRAGQDRGRRTRSSSRSSTAASVAITAGRRQPGQARRTRSSSGSTSGPRARSASYADREGVEIRYYTVIYQAIEEVEAALKGMLKPEYEEVELGTAEVREVFRSSKLGNIAGLHRPRRAHPAQRQGAPAARRRGGGGEPHDHARCKRFKDDATEVREGFECGLTLGNYNDIKVGDVIETFEMREKPRA